MAIFVHDGGVSLSDGAVWWADRGVLGCDERIWRLDRAVWGGDGGVLASDGSILGIDGAVFSSAAWGDLVDEEKLAAWHFRGYHRAMPMTVEQITAEAMSLSASTRAELADKLVVSLGDEMDAELEKLWVTAAERRALGEQRRGLSR